MAVIAGMTPVDINDVKPVELPFSEMAAGLSSVQKRADEVKNTIALGDSALAIETRPLQGDMDIANELQNEYKGEVNKILESVGGDWSKIDNSQIQALATNFATDDRVRYLTSAKKNYDAYLETQKKLQAEGGTPLMFGPIDPLKDSIKDEQGNWKNFGDWDLQNQLDHIKRAQSLFHDLGADLRDKTNFVCPQNASVQECEQQWRVYWNEIVRTKKSNIPQIQSIIDNGIDLFSDTEEGRQYIRMKTQEIKQLDSNLSDMEINNIVRSKIFDMIFSIGKSMQSTIDSEKAEKKIIIKPEPREAGGGGAGDKKEIPPTIASPMVSRFTYGNTKLTTNPTDAANEILNDNFQIPDWKEAVTNPLGLNNINALTYILTAVTDEGNILANNTNKNPGDKKYFPGVLYTMDNMNSGDNPYAGDKNRTIAIVGRADVMGKTSEDKYKYLTSTKAGENILYDEQDYIQAYKQINPGKNDYDAKTGLFGSSNMHGYTSSIEVEKTEDGTINFGQSKMLTTVLNNLKAKEPKDAYTLEKIKRIEQKLSEVNDFLNDESNAAQLKTFKNKYFSLHTQAKVYQELDMILLSKNGLNAPEFKEQMEKIQKQTGQPGDWRHRTDNIFQEVKDESVLKFINDNLTYAGAGSDAQSPIGILKALGGEKELSKNKGKADLFEIVNQTFENALYQQLSINDIKSTIDKAHGIGAFKKLMETNPYNSSIMYKYADALFIANNNFGLDMKEAQAQSIRNNVRGFFGRMGVNVSGGGMVAFKNIEFDNKGNIIKGGIEYKEERTGAAALDQINNSKKKLFDDKLKEVPDGMRNQLLSYYNDLNEMKKAYEANNMVYGVPGDTAEGGWKNLNKRMADQIFNAVTNPDIKAYKTKWNTDDESKGEFNKADIQASMNAWMASTNKVDPNEFYDTFFQGIAYDYENEKRPFSAVLNLPQYDKSGKILHYTPIQLEVTPDPEDLAALNINLLDMRFFNTARTQMNSNNKTHFDLEFGGKTQRFYHAPVDLGSDIKRGEFFVLNESGKPVPVGSIQNAIKMFAGDIFKNENKGFVDEVQADIRLAEKNPRHPYLIQKYGNLEDGDYLSYLRDYLQDYYKRLGSSNSSNSAGSGK